MGHFAHTAKLTDGGKGNFNGELLKAGRLQNHRLLREREFCRSHVDTSFEKNTSHGDHHGSQSPGTHRPPIVNGRTQEG